MKDSIFFAIAAVAVVVWNIPRFRHLILQLHTIISRLLQIPTRQSPDFRVRGNTEPRLALQAVISEDGAGQWPPMTKHENWPQPLQPYRAIYFQLNSILSTAEPLLDDDEANHCRRRRFQLEMRELLATHIVLEQVEMILEQAADGNWSDFSRASYNGFYCCIAMLRHAYRWGTNPVVKIAQMDKTISFPPELDIPWTHLQQKFGLTSDGGNLTSNMLYNVNQQGKVVYEINGVMSDVIRQSEQNFANTFRITEVHGGQIYRDLVEAIATFDNGAKLQCLHYMESVTKHLRSVLHNFFSVMRDEKISKKYWLSYVQGFHAWGAGQVVDGEVIEYDGVSGSHTLLFQVLDAFLGLESFTADNDRGHYIPFNQRRLCAALRKHSFRGSLGSNSTDVMIQEEIAKIIKLIRTFRAGHHCRAMPYLEEPALERLPMTAGMSVLDPSLASKREFDVKEALKPLSTRLKGRVKAVF